MGERGPAPKPTHLKLLEGNPGKRPINQNEPKPRPLMPQRPSWLTGEAKKCWERLAPICSRMGTLTEADGEAFASLCMSWADMVDNWRIVKEWKRQAKTSAKEKGKMDLGAVMKTATGYLQQIPEVAMYRQASKEFRAWCGQFGLTPSARTGLTVDGDDPDDDMENLLSGK